MKEGTAMLRKSVVASGLMLLMAPAAASIPPPFAWLTGHWWMSGKDGAWAEEIWTPIRGDRQMIGAAHTGKTPAKTDVFEFMRIAWDGKHYVFYAQPNGAPAVPFAQTGGSPDCPVLPCRIVFENPGNDYPKRIEYRLEKAGELTATISGADPARDRMSWTYRKLDRR
jgi:hypothetical protein